MIWKLIQSSWRLVRFFRPMRISFCLLNDSITTPTKRFRKSRFVMMLTKIENKM